MSDELRIWIAVRKDLEMPAGKMAVQVAHAATSAIWAGILDRKITEYMNASQAKIVVEAKNLDDLIAIRDAAAACYLPAGTIIDAGRTVFTEPTATCVWIGPTTRSALPSKIKRLRLWQNGSASE